MHEGVSIAREGETTPECAAQESEAADVAGPLLNAVHSGIDGHLGKNIISRQMMGPVIMIFRKHMNLRWLDELPDPGEHTRPVIDRIVGDVPGNNQCVQAAQDRRDAYKGSRLSRSQASR